MWTTDKPLWLDADGKPTGTKSKGVVPIAAPYERVALSYEDAKRLGLTGRAAKLEAEPESEPASEEPT
jgi:hypothetical protein